MERNPRYLKADSRSSSITHLWTEEAVEYLGLDRLGLNRPEKALYRLVKKGSLHPAKISGHFAFSKKELDRLLANGDQKPKRGRPRKYHSA